MEYPLISEYREAILSAEDNFNELSSLRPVLDSNGSPVMSSGNFAVVFKMRDEKDGKLYAVKCFIKEQEGRNESYRKIADELDGIPSSYLVSMRYIENELFVDTAQCECEEFPVVLMEWVDGEPLDAYLKRNIDDRYELEMLSYRFNRMAAWLLTQPFAHGDLKPDNILVRQDGSLVLVDYDGMFVPSMKGELAREVGSPDYRHPSRTDKDFNERIDDFSIAVIALSLKAISLKPELRGTSTTDTLLFTERDFCDPSSSVMLKEILALIANKELSLLLGTFFIAIAQNSLDLLSFKTFVTERPEKPKFIEIEKVDTSVTEKDIAEGVKDEFGVLYSKDGKRLLRSPRQFKVVNYNIKDGTIIICDSAFANHLFLKSVSIPSSVTTIGAGAFGYCSSLRNINLPDSVKTLGTNPFMGCGEVQLSIAANSCYDLINGLLIDSKGKLISCLNHLQKVFIPSSVTTIGDSAFGGCESLRSVNIPSSVRIIGHSSFGGCESLQSVSIPSSVTIIGDSAFRGCGSLQSVNIPSSVTTIGSSAFEDCYSLRSVNIPSSVTTIGHSVFGWCCDLQNINLPDSVKTLGHNPFAGCKRLHLSVAEKSGYTLIDGLLIDSKGLLVSCQDRSSMISIPSSVTIIGDSAFMGCGSLQSVNISSSVTTIHDSAFWGCESLRSVNIPSSVTTIGDSAFRDCSSLQSVNIPSSVTTIGGGLFWGCESLQRVSIPSSVTTIGEGAFGYCKSLRSVSIPSSVTTIGYNTFISFDVVGVFEGCSSLERVNIPSSVTTIGDNAFSGCKSLQSVSIPSSVTTIGEGAFRWCSSLDNVSIPDSLIVDEDKVFPSDCKIIRRK